MKKLFFLFLLALIVPNIALVFTESQNALTGLCNILLPLAVYWRILSIFRNPGKAIWVAFPFVFLAAFQIVLLYLFGRAIIGVDMFLNLVTTNSDEVSELLGNLLPAVIGVFVIYIPFLILGIVGIHRKWKLPLKFLLLQRKLSLYALACLLPLTGVYRIASPSFRFSNDVFPINVCYNLVLAINRSHDMANYPEKSKSFQFKAVSTRPDSLREIYVLVIGETARARNFQLYGYSRPTNPLLIHTKGLITFTSAMSQSNTTHKSVPMLLSAATAENYDCIYQQKGILSAFREAGFKTGFFSNQRRNHAFIDIFGMEAETWKFIKDGKPTDKNVYDEELLPYVKQILKKKYKKLFIVLHTYGSHFNYRERYPKDFAYFLPDAPTEAKASNRPTLVNAYDNSIRYTDHLLSRLIAMLNAERAHSAILYTSDHGEDIFDDERELFLHASPVPSLNQLQVPLLVWLSDDYRKAYPNIALQLEKNKQKPVATSRSVFHSLLKIGGIKTPLYCPEFTPADPSYKVLPYHYLTDRNQPISLQDMNIE